MIETDITIYNTEDIYKFDDILLDNIIRDFSTLNFKYSSEILEGGFTINKFKFKYKKCIVVVCSDNSLTIRPKGIFNLFNCHSIHSDKVKVLFTQLMTIKFSNDECNKIYKLKKIQNYLK